MYMVCVCVLCGMLPSNNAKQEQNTMSSDLTPPLSSTLLSWALPCPNLPTYLPTYLPTQYRYMCSTP